MTAAIHWIGGVITRRTTLAPGWPACCSGERARLIAADPGRCTHDPDQVTCEGCQVWLVKGALYERQSSRVRHEVVTDAIAGRALTGTGLRAKERAPRRGRKGTP